MRLLIGSLLVLVLGGILAAAFTLHPSTPTQADLAQIKTTCAECHKVPFVRSADSVHAAHQNLACVTCHTSGTTARVNFNSCVPCHSVPAYTSTVAVHDAHATTDCVVCHGETAGLATANNASNTLKIAGIGIVCFGLAGIILNFIIIKAKPRRRK